MMLFRSTDTAVLDLLEESGRNVQRATLLLRDLIAEYPERADLARDLLLSEQEGDRITHDIIHRLNGGGNGRPPMDPADGHLLATTSSTSPSRRPTSWRSMPSRRRWSRRR